MIVYEDGWKKLKKTMISSKNVIILTNLEFIEQMLDFYDNLDFKTHTERTLYVKFGKGSDCNVIYNKFKNKWVMTLGADLVKASVYTNDRLQSVATHVGHEYAHYYYEDPKYLGMKLSKILLEYNVFAETRADLYGKRLAMQFYGGYNFDWMSGGEDKSLNLGYLPYKKRYEIANSNYKALNTLLVEEILRYISKLNKIRIAKGQKIYLHTTPKFISLSKSYETKNKEMYDWVVKLVHLRHIKVDYLK